MPDIVIRERGESVKKFVQFVNDRTREATQQPKEQTLMTDRDQTLLVHLVRASVFIESPSDTGQAKTEIDAAIALLMAEKPKRTRKSKND